MSRFLLEKNDLMKTSSSKNVSVTVAIASK